MATFLLLEACATRPPAVTVAISPAASAHRPAWREKLGCDRPLADSREHQPPRSYVPADLVGRRVERVDFRGYRCLELDALRIRARAVAVGAPLDPVAVDDALHEIDSIVDIEDVQAQAEPKGDGVVVSFVVHEHLHR